MTDFKTRLIAERDDLQERLSKLEPFLYTEQFGKLPVLHQQLLEKQRDQMSDLLVTLNTRLAHL